MNSQNSEETKTPMIPPGFEMKNDVGDEEKSEKNVTCENDKSGEEEVVKNQVLQNSVTIVNVENKDESKTSKFDVESHKSTEEFNDYEKVELIDCNVDADDQESKIVKTVEKDVENESKSVQLAVTETKNPETDQQNAKQIESVNVQMDENDGEKPKIVTLEEMFDETELEKFEQDANDANNFGDIQQNLGSMTASVKVEDSEAKSDKLRESDAINVQNSEIYNVDPHAVTVASDVEHLKDISKAKLVDKEHLNNEDSKIQQEEKSLKKNESDEIKGFLGTALMIVNTESSDEDKSKVPKDKVVKEESIPKNANFEIGQKEQCEIAFVYKPETDKTEVFADKIDVEKEKESIQSEIVHEQKDVSSESDIRVDTKDVTSGSDDVQMNKNENELKSEQSRGSVVSTPNEESNSESKNVLLKELQQEKNETLKVSDISLKADDENKKDGKVAALASDESQTNEQHEIQPAKGLVKSFSNTLVNLFSCGNDVTSINEDTDSESVQTQNVQHENNASFYTPDVGKVAAAVDEVKKDENITVDKIQVVEKNEVIQNQPIQTFNLFSSQNVDAEIEKSRLQNNTISQDEQKDHSYSPGFEHEKVIENQRVQPNVVIQQQNEVHEIENKISDENRVTREHVEEIPTEKPSTPTQASETLKDETDKLQQRQQLLNDNNDSGSDVKDDVNVGDSASTITENENISTTELAISPSEPHAAENVLPNDSFNPIFDEYFTKFFEIESLNLEVTAIQDFAETIPTDFIVSEDRYQILFKVLFKIKEISNKAVFDESLKVLKKFFWNLDYNKFLLQFWSCKEFKNHENGPIGFSFTEGSALIVLTGNLPKHERDVEKINEKAVEAAWSMLLDVEATVTKVLENVFANKAMNSFFTAVFRKLQCLGEFMIVIDGKNLPIFFHFYSQVFGGSDGNKLIIGLTLLVNVCKTPKNENGSALIKPNFVLQEIMSHLICDDEKKETYMLALKRFFDQPLDLKCEMKWNSESDEYENPAVFFKSFIKYFNRKQKVVENNVVFAIFEEFKKSLDQSETKIENLEKLDENTEVDWPFVYKIVNLLDIQNFQLKIPESLYMILPEEDMEKFTFFTEEEPSLEKALTAIVELHFVTVDTIPDISYKNLWSAFPPSEKDSIGIFATSIIQAYNNLKSTIDVKIGLQFIVFIQQICEVLLEKNVFQQISRTFRTDFAYISANSYLIVIARTLRAVVEEKVENGSKLPFNSISPFFTSLVNLFSVQSFDLFGKIRNDTRDKFAPWRRGNADCMADEMSMAINFLLNAIQKDIYFVFDQTFKHTQHFIDVLIYLCKQRYYYGVHHPRLEILLLEKLPNFYEPHGFLKNDQGQYYRNQENRRDDFGQQQRFGRGNNQGGDNFGRGGHDPQNYQNCGQRGNTDAPRGRGYSTYRDFGAPDQNGDQNERASCGQQRGGSSQSIRGFSSGASETGNHIGRGSGRGADTNVPTNHRYSGFNVVPSNNDRPVLGQSVRGGSSDFEGETQSNRGRGGRGSGHPTLRGGGYRGYSTVSENAPGNSQNDRQSIESFQVDGTVPQGGW